MHFCQHRRKVFAQKSDFRSNSKNKYNILFRQIFSHKIFPGHIEGRFDNSAKYFPPKGQFLLAVSPKKIAKLRFFVRKNTILSRKCFSKKRCF